MQVKEDFVGNFKTEPYQRPLTTFFIPRPMIVITAAEAIIQLQLYGTEIAWFVTVA